MKGAVYIRKFFLLPNSLDYSKGRKATNDLNRLLECVGVQFDLEQIEKGYKLNIEVNEDKLKATTTSKAGRPVEHEIDFVKVQQLKADGKTNKEIYEALGISKSLFYMKMKEYKNKMDTKRKD